MLRSPRLRFISAVSLLLCSVAVLPHAMATSPRQDRQLALRLAAGRTLDPVLSALADGRLVRSVGAPASGAIDVAAVPLGFALTASQLAPLDVTSTPEASRALAAYLDRLRSRGIDIESTPFTVYTLPDIEEASAATMAAGGTEAEPLGSSLIVPTGTTVEFVGAVFEHGVLHAKTTVSAGPDPMGNGHGGGTFRSMFAPSGSEVFERRGGVTCMDRQQNSTAHYDPCQWFYKVVNERDPNFDYWASEMYGTGKSHSVWTLSGLEVDSRRTEGTPRQEWMDWDPGADAETACRSQSVSVSYAGASVGVEKQHCELWDIDKGSAAFDMSNWWRGDVWRSERETAAVTLTKLREGELPHGDFDFDYHAHP